MTEASLHKGRKFSHLILHAINYSHHASAQNEKKLLKVIQFGEHKREKFAVFEKKI